MLKYFFILVCERMIDLNCFFILFLGESDWPKDSRSKNGLLHAMRLAYTRLRPSDAVSTRHVYRVCQQHWPQFLYQVNKPRKLTHFQEDALN